MTNQEAVKMLRTIKGTVYLGNRKFEDAISYAISALEQPIEPQRMRGRWVEDGYNDEKDDLISRQAAIDALSKMKIYRPLDSDRYVISDCLNKIVNLPSAQPERKTGRWVERNPQNSPDCRLIECSECGNAYIVGYNIDYDDWIDGRNFCMKCGADMRGIKNECYKRKDLKRDITADRQAGRITGDPAADRRL